MFSALEPCAAYDLRASAPALEAPPHTASDGGDEYSLRDDCTAAQAASCSLFPSSEPTGPEEAEANRAADFLGRLHHLKKMLRMSATGEPVSVLIHKVGPLLVLDDGPSLESARRDAPTLESGASYEQSESQLMLAALDASIETALRQPAAPPPGLPPPPESELQGRLCVRNTFLDLDDSDHESVGRTHSAPGRVEGDTPRSILGSADFSGEGAEPSALQRALQRHSANFADSWSLIPYDPESVSDDLARHWELLQCSSGGGAAPGSAIVEAARSLFEDIPPQPSRFGRAVEWRCGPYKILLGCDLVVLRSADQSELHDFASFKLMSPNVSQPSKEERLDVYLENTMCDITKVVWGCPQGEAMSWRVCNTADLPQSSGEAERFDPDRLHEHGRQLLHFLRQRCRREGGTYWLFREQNSSRAELFDISNSVEREEEDGNWETSAAFRTTPSLAPPIASLCFHLAKSMARDSDQRQLLQKATHLLEPLKEEQYGLYATAALQLACSYMRTPVAAISDKAEAATATAPPGEAPPAARLSVALRYLEKVLRLLSRLGDDASTLRAGLLLQGQVAYAECIVKLVKEACIPTYSAWLAQVQKSSQELIQKHGAASAAAQKQLSQMKQLSAAFLLWRLFWLCRAHRALGFLAAEKREVECWTLDRDLMEVMGDTLYGLSRYPADDVKSLLSGQMSSAEGICSIVAAGLRSWGLSGGKVVVEEGGRRSKRRLASPATSGDEAPPEPYDVGAMFLSKMNPLHRDLGDRALAEDSLVRDDLRPKMWTEGSALQRCLACYSRAVARLRAKGEAETDPQSLKVARKLAHLYNEEARAALADGHQNEKAEDLLQQAQHWMALSGDRSNASRVLLNLSELYARRAEQGMEGGEFGEVQYMLFLRCAETCEEAVRLSDGTLGKREGAFAHLRLAVHLSMRVPTQTSLGGRRQESVAELADRHLGKALRLFDEIKDEREVAVCHFHMADLVLQEQKVPGAAPLSKARLTSAMRHAKRSAEFWEKSGVRTHAKDFISSHVRIARLLECQPRTGAKYEAVLHLAERERQLLSSLRGDVKGLEESLFLIQKGRPVSVPPLRTEMGRICQAGIRAGEDINRLKVLYRQVLRNESVADDAA